VADPEQEEETIRASRRAGFPWAIPGALVLLSGTMIGAMVYGLRTGTRMSVRSAPLVNAAMEIRLQATSSHLWFEEILSGDSQESMNEVWDHLESAEWYARAMLEGGTNDEGTFYPLEDPALRTEIREILARLGDFRRITTERWNARLVSAAGTEMDREYDEIFQGFLALAGHVEGQVRDAIDRDVRSFRRTQQALIAGAVLLALLIGAALVRYITSQARAEARAEELWEQLTHAARVGTMGELATGIAHEINQPLTAISTVSQTYTRLLQRGGVDPAEVREAMAGITAQAMRAGDVMRNLRSLVRGGESSREVVDVNALVRDVVKLARGHVEMRGARTRLDLGPHLPSALADRVQIQQVVLNLIQNGLESLNGTAGDGAEITVATRAHGTDEIEVRVIDRGTGISYDAEEHLFQPFFTTKGSGLGLGLSICWSIVSAHDGRLWFTRNPDRGTTMHFTLPTAGERT
jgi:C4-dicarboxylate-specific signal transduction histidine kinase